MPGRVRNARTLTPQDVAFRKAAGFLGSLSLVPLLGESGALGERGEGISPRGSTMAEPGTPPVIGIIGGSGIYEIEGLGNAEWRSIESPFGAPPDALLCGELDGQRPVFLPPPGRRHKPPPSALTPPANPAPPTRARAPALAP